MKSVLISIQPYWVFLIIAKKMGWNIDKEKTVEVRKTYPKAEGWNKTVEIYCSKDKKSLAKIPKEYQPFMEQFLGKVIGEFVCDKIIDIKPFGIDNIREFENQTCLTSDEIVDYLNGFYGYGWHISDLVIYDKPKELGEFFKVGHSEYCKSEWEERERLRIQLDKHNEITGDKAHLNTDSDFENILKMLSPFKVKRPPQSWCYVEQNYFKE